ncbi:MAG: tetratricopeptide repeat protein [bacterium]
MVNLIEQKIAQIERLKKLEEEKKKKEKEIEILCQKAMSLYENYQLEESLLEFEKILKLDSNHILACEKTKEIKKYFSFYDKKTREEIEQYFNFGLKKIKENNWQEALSAFKKVLQINPYHENAKKYLEEVRRNLLKRNTKIELANFYYNKGMKNINDQNWQEARGNFEEVLVFDFSFQKARNKIKEIEILQKKSIEKKHYEQGVKYFKKENWQEAIKEFEEILKINPNHEKAKEKYYASIECLKMTYGGKKIKDIINEFLNKGNSCLKKREWENSIVFFTKALEINKDSKEAIEGINKANYLNGIELVKKSKFKNAKEKFKSVLEKQDSLQIKTLCWCYFSIFLYYLVTKLFFIPILLILFAMISFIVLIKKHPNDY